MQREEPVWERLCETIVAFLGEPPQPITPETTAADLPGWDSLAHVELMVEIEDAFGIRFRTGEVASLASVGELAELIASARGR